MGQTASEIQEAQRKIDAEHEKQANDALNSLQEIAKKNMELFRAKIAGPQPLIIPISKIMEEVNVVRCSVSSDAKALKDAISKTIGAVAKGDWVDAITTVVGIGLDELFGSYQGSVSEKDFYTVAVGPLGGVYRFDYKMFSYQYTSQSLMSISKNVVACSVILSSADVKPLGRNDCRVLIQNCFGNLPVEKQKEYYDNLWNAVQEAQKSDVHTPELLRRNQPLLGREDKHVSTPTTSTTTTGATGVEMKMLPATLAVVPITATASVAAAAAGERAYQCATLESPAGVRTTYCTPKPVKDHARDWVARLLAAHPADHLVHTRMEGARPGGAVVFE